MKKIKENIFNLILIAFIVFLLFACKKQIILVMHYFKRADNFRFIFPFVDNQIENDTFFTVAIGRSIMENGFSNLDVLTWHENLAFPHSGIFDLIIYGVYNITKDFTSIYIYTILMTCILLGLLFFVSYKMSKNIIASVIYTLCAWFLGNPTFCARAFQFSFIFFVLEFYFIDRLLEKNEKKYSIILILLGIFIANIHSSVYPIYFVMFLPHIVEIILGKLNIKIPKIDIEKRRGERLLFVTFVIGLFTGLCSFAGFAPYTDMLKVMMGMSNEFIGEIAPTTFENNKIFFAIILVVILFIVNGKQKIKLSDLLYILGFGVLTLLVYRGFFFFVFLSGISITKVISSFFVENEIKINKYLKILAFAVSGVLFILVMSADSLRVMEDELIPKRDYPVELSEYILENVDLENMRIYNHFNYGSYLEYKGIKAFIDSRSGMFCEEFNPGCTILEDWYAVDNGDKDYSEIFEKYDITHVVSKKFDTLANKLEEDENYDLIYSDKYWVLYERNNGDVYEK